MPAGFVQAGERYDRFDFVGAHSTDGKTVMHVGLLTSGVTGGPALEVDVFEVGPPPRLGPGDGKTGKMKAHVVAWGALTPEQRSGIERTMADLRKTVSAKPIRTRADVVSTYIAVPPIRQELAEDGVTLLSVRFSCAGLIAYCYEKVQILLIELHNLPSVSREMLDSIWPHLRNLDDEERATIGLPGDGPWPVLLPGYLFHSLARTAGGSAPLTPQLEQAAFPPPAEATKGTPATASAGEAEAGTNGRTYT